MSVNEEDNKEGFMSADEDAGKEGYLSADEDDDDGEDWSEYVKRRKREMYERFMQLPLEEKRRWVEEAREIGARMARKHGDEPLPPRLTIDEEIAELEQLYYEFYGGGNSSSSKK